MVLCRLRSTVWPDISHGSRRRIVCGSSWAFSTLVGRRGLFWRWFTPDSGIVGPDKFTVPAVSGLLDTGAIFLSGNTLYVSNRTTGTLSTRAWNNGVPGSIATIVSGPLVDGVDWRARAVFIGP